MSTAATSNAEVNQYVGFDFDSQPTTVETRNQIRNTLPLDAYIRSYNIITDSQGDRDDKQIRSMEQGREGRPEFPHVNDNLEISLLTNTKLQLAGTPNIMITEMGYPGSYLPSLALM